MNQIISKDLQKLDNDCMLYTTSLMDKLEQAKTEHSSEDIFIDEVAGQAYVEEFAQETFERADRAVKANKVTT